MRHTRRRFIISQNRAGESYLISLTGTRKSAPDSEESKRESAFSKTMPSSCQCLWGITTIFRNRGVLAKNRVSGRTPLASGGGKSKIQIL